VLPRRGRAKSYNLAQGYSSPDLAACPRRRQLGAIQPRSKQDDSTCARVTRLRVLSRGQCRRHAVGNRAARAEQTCSTPGLFALASSDLCWPALLSEPLEVRSRSAHSRPASWPDQRSELLPSRYALRLSPRARRTPFVAGCLRDGRKVGSVLPGDDRTLSPESAVAHTGRSMGPVDTASPKA